MKQLFKKTRGKTQRKAQAACNTFPAHMYAICEWRMETSERELIFIMISVKNLLGKVSVFEYIFRGFFLKFPSFFNLVHHQNNWLLCSFVSHSSGVILLNFEEHNEKLLGGRGWLASVIYVLPSRHPAKNEFFT